MAHLISLITACACVPLSVSLAKTSLKQGPRARVSQCNEGAHCVLCCHHARTACDPLHPSTALHIHGGLLHSPLGLSSVRIPQLSHEVAIRARFGTDASKLLLPILSGAHSKHADRHVGQVKCWRLAHVMSSVQRKTQTDPRPRPFSFLPSQPALVCRSQ